jgi:HEAT repeat protein
MNVFMNYIFMGLLLAQLGASSVSANEPEWPVDLSKASMDTLMIHVQQYGNTPGREQRRAAATTEVIARGTNALHYLMAHCHIENMAVRMMADQLVRVHLEDDDVATVLLRYLDDPREKIRKTAVYFLGFCKTPAHSASVLPLLTDEAASGAAMRTLGKWSCTNAVPGIVLQMHHEKERRRILAVNALGAIGDRRSVPFLVDALDDNVFTVRKAAREALAGFGATVLGELTEVLPDQAPVAQREIISLLREGGYGAALQALSNLVDQASSPSVAADAQAAFEQLQSAAAASE